MPNPDQYLYLLINAGLHPTGGILALARFASVELPQYIIAGIGGALLVGDAGMRRTLLRVLGAMMMAWIIARVFQHWMPLERPQMRGLGTAWLEHGNSASFPSTHASVAFAFACALPAVSRHPGLRAAAWLAAGLVAWSRVYLGVHFPSDILGGLGVGAFSAWAVCRLPRPMPVRVPAHD